MADSTASLSRRIATAADLRSVVRAMKAQAAAQMGQYEQSVAALGDYARTVDLALGACLRQAASQGEPEVPAQTGPRVVQAIVFGSDQGLVGRFNDIVVEHARSTLPAGAQVWAVGERVRAHLVARGLAPLGAFALPASVQGIAGLVGQILTTVVEASRQAGATLELKLIYNRPQGGDAYAPVDLPLLPLDEAWRRALAQQAWPGGMQPEVLADLAVALRDLIGEHLFIKIFQASAESLASENASRLAAMERADRNIDKMLVTLGDTFHRLRQGGIDEELSDVIGGFKAVSGRV